MSPFDFLFKKREVEEGLLGIRQPEKGVLEDGARLLQDILSSCDGNVCHPIRMFSVKEIEHVIKDTNGSILTCNYTGTYGAREIFIKAYQGERELAFNEIATVIQINHGNVVKLLGCCFEMVQPLLVYELLPTNLSRCLHKANQLSSGPISWEHRLRIAVEIANAITYLHIAKSSPIVHRNITSSNILLDEQYRSKLCGFTLSVIIPLGKTHVKMEHEHVKMEDVSGTRGYLDPYYRNTLIVSEKTDVYSFGMLLLEMLSGKTPHEITRGELWDGYYEIKIEKDEIIQLVLENGLSMDAGQLKQSGACADLVGRCLLSHPYQRPPMKEVAQQLQLIQKM